MHVLLANKLGALGVLISDRVEGSLHGLSPSAAAVLSMLHFKPGLNSAGLAAVCDVRQPTIVRLLDGLARQGLVERGEPQGRATPLSVTPFGRDRADAVQQARLTALDALLSALDDDERATFETLVDKILAGATESRAMARTTCRLCEHDLCAPAVCPVGLRADEVESGGDDPTAADARSTP